MTDCLCQTPMTTKVFPVGKKLAIFMLAAVSLTACGTNPPASSEDAATFRGGIAPASQRAAISSAVVKAGEYPVGLADLPASYEREMPGANSLVRQHLDLLPEGRYQMRMDYLDKPEPNQVDHIGRWRYDSDNARLEFYWKAESPVYYSVEKDGRELMKLDVDGKPLDSKNIPPLERLPQPETIEPHLTLTGMFSYMADAASITLCDDERRLPVAMELDFTTLERAYLNAKPQPGQALLVSLDGTISQRPAMEESQAPRSTLIVNRFQNIFPRESCGQPAADSPLRGTYWKLVRLNGEPVPAPKQKQEAHLIFSTEAMRLSGNSGCNRVMGSFEVDGDKLRLGQMAGTMMACLDGMDLEQRFLKALNNVDSYRIGGSHLEMLDASGTVIARFEAVALR